MGHCWDQIRGIVRRVAFGFHPHTLHPPRVPRANFHAYAGDDFGVAFQELCLRFRGSEELLQVARAIALGGVMRVLPFASLYIIPSARESRHQAPVLAPNVPAAMVEMQVGVDDDIDVRRI